MSGFSLNFHPGLNSGGRWYRSFSKHPFPRDAAPPAGHHLTTRSPVNSRWHSIPSGGIQRPHNVRARRDLKGLPPGPRVWWMVSTLKITPGEKLVCGRWTPASECSRRPPDALSFCPGGFGVGVLLIKGQGKGKGHPEFLSHHFPGEESCVRTASTSLDSYIIEFGLILLDPPPKKK